MLRLAKLATPQTTPPQTPPKDGNTMLGEAWPTPTTTDAKSSARHGYMITGQQGTTLLDAVRLWPTPNATVANDGESAETWRARQESWKTEYDSRAPGEVKAGNGAGLPLTIAAKEWATPVVSESANRTRTEPTGGYRGGAHLSAQAIGAQWSTPTTQDSENDGPPSAFSRRTLPLNAAVRVWPTPDAGSFGNQPNANTKEWGGQNTLVSFAVKGDHAMGTPPSPPDPTTPKAGRDTSSDTRVLNPRFVEVLMGFPPGWTDCALSETPSSLRRRAQLSAFLLSATAPMPSPATREG